MRPSESINNSRPATQINASQQDGRDREAAGRMGGNSRLWP